MGLRLEDNWVILKDPKNYYLTNLNYPKCTWWTLDKYQCLVLTCRDGATSENTIKNNLTSTFNLNKKRAGIIYDKIVYRFRHCIKESSRTTLSSPQVFSLKEPLPISKGQADKNCAPMRLTWVTSIFCDKKCKYCYMDAKPITGSIPSLPKEELSDIAEEAIDLAVSEIVMTGGDPFVFPDIYDAINIFANKQITINVGTKSYIDSSKFSDNTKNFLKVEQSLDSTNKSMVSFLTGSSYAYDEAISSINGFIAAGIRFSIKMVIGNHNAEHIPEMALFCKNHGAESLQIVEYKQSFGRNLEGFAFSDEKREMIKGMLHLLKKTFGLEIQSDLLQQKTKFLLPGSNCGEGIRTLSFFSDGTCLRCPALPYHKIASSCNIFKNTIYASWNNKKYKSMVTPVRENFKLTTCYTCKSFDECNYTGRCILRALQRTGSYFGPDRICKYEEKILI